MNTGQAQRSANSSLDTFEDGEHESYLGGFNRALADWVEALTGYRTPASSRARILENWAAEEGQGEAENRQQGRSRIRAAENIGSHLVDLSSLSLTALPDALPPRLRELRAMHNELGSLPARLPPGLNELLVSHNQLTSLPDVLPASLYRLEANDNRLTSLPADLPPGLGILSANNNRLVSLPDALPTGLTSLAVSGNQLTELPVLPSGLIEIDVSSNQLTSLPEPLPGWLQSLNLSGNRLTGLPEDLLSSLNYPNLELAFADNPLPDEVRAHLAAPHLEQRSLHEAAAHWLGNDLAALAEWQHFADEPGAQDYARFLERLRGTVNQGSDEFRQAVADDLRQAAADPRLREQFFTQASEANASCEDRITLHWNGMRTARLNAEVENGSYDDRLSELIQRARVAFRLEALDGIARDRVESLLSVDPNVDDVEVYLAYQHLLREPLELSHVAPEMRFLSVSHVTPDDAARALDLVREQEANQFTDYMATRWQPWETVLRRIAPDEYEAMQDRLVEAMGEEFQSRLDQRLAEHGLLGDPDAERVLGAQIRNQIAGEIKGEVMHRLLADRGIEQ
ncbi:C-terminal novel E3 ligase, LRR-interacting [Bradyrhizobium brasilense]|uniref:C-terminal novel E3 ligase, LRR-interacting n=1 Tax=Bradyrhizobium brasilense TaxID=1419277 RepID=A0A1G7F0M1_9BRAD|nr:NEL-type E3 ubiquitin ligase domain-containing protein [Bradyrhizobium brasilense]SDE69441.1 C-terminal novel E3 ligase, LRR-interacting [Bradyrhizobium brasilense]